MSRSVKLKDGSFVDASGVWDNDRQETVEDALKWKTTDIASWITAGGVADSKGPCWVAKQGVMVSLNISVHAPSSKAIAANTTWFTLPEGYRPKYGLSLGVYSFAATSQRIYVTIKETGAVITVDSVPANTWWSFNVTFPTDLE